MFSNRYFWLFFIASALPYFARAEGDGEGDDKDDGEAATMDRVFECNKFRCPKGKTRVQKKGYEPWAYACPRPAFDLFSGFGGGGNDGQPMPHNCCMKHEICYQMCGMDTKKCDEEYNKCSEKHCGGGNQFCRLSVMLAGNIRDVENGKNECDVYAEAQEKSCECVSDDENAVQAYTVEALEDFYGKYKKTKLVDGKLSEEDRDTIFESWEGKENEMWLALFMKYNKKAVTIRKKADPTRAAQAAKKRKEMEDDDDDEDRDDL
eukprot:GEMP01047588.1.p1 GENE.GEMP01047588.1~~GEMP01047588.1.p1  ORF type:complete len:263 (+),score=73.06 GEMP01047588.1:119-907(+)